MDKSFEDYKADIMHKVVSKMEGPVFVNKHIEDTIFDEGMAVNSRAAIRRLDELLGELKTNCLKDEAARNDERVKRLIWFLNAQFHGMTADIDMYKEWRELYDEYSKPIKKEDAA